MFYEKRPRAFPARVPLRHRAPGALERACSMNDWLGIAALFVLVLFNGFFVAAEYALVSVRRTRIDQRAEEGNSSAKLVQRVLGNLSLYIAAIQLGVSMASLAIGFVAEPAIEHLAEPLFVRAGLPEAYLKTASFAIAFILSTTLHIVFGELFPKSAALQRTEEVALSFTRPLMLFTAVFRPVILALNFFGAVILRLFGLKATAGHPMAHSEEEIRMIVSASSQEGVLAESERELVNNVFDLADTAVRSIMTPRVDMVMVEGAWSLRGVLELYERHNYSRVPVFSESPDNVIGVVHTPDVLKHLHELEHVTARDIMRPTYYAPESMRVSDLLRTMRERKGHMAIVVDEFGGTAGVVTLEDVLEEIVGEIYDETDEEEVQRVVQLPSGEFLLDASLGVDEVETLLSTSLDAEEEHEFDTLGGFMTQHFGYIPQAGETFTWEGWTYAVEEADQRRVVRVRASRAVPLEASPGEGEPREG